MYVCVYVCLYVCMYAFIYVCMYVFMYVLTPRLVALITHCILMRRRVWARFVRKCLLRLWFWNDVEKQCFCFRHPQIRPKTQAKRILLLWPVPTFVDRREGFELCRQARWFWKMVRFSCACRRKHVVTKIVKNWWVYGVFSKKNGTASRGIVTFFLPRARFGHKTT